MEIDDQEIEGWIIIVKTYLVLWAFCFFERYIIKGIFINHCLYGLIGFATSLVVMFINWKLLDQLKKKGE